MASNQELKDCPFCGGEMGGDYKYFTHPKNDCILSECEFDGFRRGDANGEDGYDNFAALNEWNTRADLADQPSTDKAEQEPERNMCECDNTIGGHYEDCPEYVSQASKESAQVALSEKDKT